MRYAGWRRLKGDTDRPDLLDEGKRLLGYLDNQRKLSGVPTMGQQVTLPDGSVVWARWLGEQPEILIREGGERPGPVLEGLYVRPLVTGHQRTNLDLNHVVLAHPTFRPVYYSKAMGPDTARAPYYQALFPDGIAGHGNLDWRNADETVAVTFFGPQSRYFDGSFSNRVYFKGSLVLPADAEVRGAALATSGSTGTLLVVQRTYGASIEEVLYGYPVVVDGNGENIKFAAKIKLAEETAPYGRVELAAWDYGAVFVERDHPWCFNQSGTEARCILYDPDANAHVEYRIANTGGTWGFSTVGTYDDPEVAISEESETTSTQPLTFTSTTSTVSLGVSEVPGSGIEETHTPVSIVTSTEHTCASPWVRIAVDFKNDVPVYAEARAATLSGESTYARTVEGTITHTEVPPGATTVWDGSSEATFSRSESRVEGGLRTTFGEWLHEQTLTQTSEQAGSGTATVADPDSMTADDETWSGSFTASYSYDYTSTVTYRLVEYLDLRHDFAVIGEMVTTRNEAAEDEQTHAVTNHESGYQYTLDLVLQDPVLNMLLNVDITHVLTVRAYLGGAQVAALDPVTTFYNTITPALMPGLTSDDRYYANRASDNQPIYGMSLVHPINGDGMPAYGTTGPSDSSSVSDTLRGVVDPMTLCDWLELNGTVASRDYADVTIAFTGGAQTYRGDFVFSMALSASNIPASTTTEHRLFAAGKAGQSVALSTITDIASPRFHPVSFLPRTR